MIKKEFPLVSVVTPSYNQGDFIRDTIESVLTQDYPNIEYIVIDGGSSDKTVDILKSYNGKFNWVSEKDKGQSDAINKGIARSHGSIVTWLCSDDSYLPGAVLKVVEEFRRNPNVDIIYGDVYYSDIKNKPRMLFKGRQFDLREAISTSFNPIPQASSFIKRSAWEKVGGLRESLRFIMDWDLWLRMGKDGCNLHYIPEILANARMQPYSKTVAGSAGVAEALITIIIDFFADSDQLSHGLIRIKKRALSSAYLRASLEFYQALETKKARRSFLKGLSLYPPNLLSDRYAEIFVRSCLGKRLVSTLREIKIRSFPNSKRAWANK